MRSTKHNRVGSCKRENMQREINEKRRRRDNEGGGVTETLMIITELMREQ